jgi:hypothetical protein
VSGAAWIEVTKYDPRAAALADRHYSRQRPGTRQFMPPGRTLILLTPDARAVWGVSLNLDPRGSRRWRCTLFRNEGDALSSDLIRAATAATFATWSERYGLPGVPLTTEVDPEAVRPKRDPGTVLPARGMARAARRAARQAARQARRARRAGGAVMSDRVLSYEFVTRADVAAFCDALDLASNAYDFVAVNARVVDVHCPADLGADEQTAIDACAADLGGVPPAAFWTVTHAATGAELGNVCAPTYEEALGTAIRTLAVRRPDLRPGRLLLERIDLVDVWQETGRGLLGAGWYAAHDDAGRVGPCETKRDALDALAAKSRGES